MHVKGRSIDFMVAKAQIKFQCSQDQTLIMLNI